MCCISTDRNGFWHAFIFSRKGRVLSFSYLLSLRSVLSGPFLKCRPFLSLPPIMQLALKIALFIDVTFLWCQCGGEIRRGQQRPGSSPAIICAFKCAPIPDTPDTCCHGNVHAPARGPEFLSSLMQHAKSFSRMSQRTEYWEILLPLGYCYRVIGIRACHILICCAATGPKFPNSFLLKFLKTTDEDKTSNSIHCKKRKIFRKYETTEINRKKDFPVWL